MRIVFSRLQAGAGNARARRFLQDDVLETKEAQNAQEIPKRCRRVPQLF